jgi:hypothetical protein
MYPLIFLSFHSRLRSSPTLGSPSGRGKGGNRKKKERKKRNKSKEKKKKTQKKQKKKKKKKTTTDSTRKLGKQWGKVGKK